MLKISINGGLISYGFKGEQYVGSLANRGDVIGFSRSSRSRMLRYIRGSLAEYKYFFTLTYPANQNTWFEFKQHFKRFIERFRREQYFERHEASWFWFMEFQSRGAPHFHIYATHRIKPKHLSEVWYESVGSEDPAHALAGTNIKKFDGNRSQIIAYASKYAQKSEQKSVPVMFKDKKIGRYWGVVGFRGTLSADILYNPASANKEQLEVLKQLERAINETASETHCTKWNWGGFSFLNQPVFNKARHIHTIISSYRQLEWAKQDALTEHRAQQRGNLRQKTLRESQAMHYRQAKAKEK